MDGDSLKKVLQLCAAGDCLHCSSFSDDDCMEVVAGDSLNYITELEERIAIKDEALEALEQRCNALEALEKRLKDPDRINVTHCKDCKHLFDGEQTENCCDVLMEKTGWMHEISVSPDWYCADGETR